MSNLLKVYGIRKCLVCQKTFEAIQPAQVTCSEKCRNARRKALKRETRKRNNEILWENMEWLNCKLEEIICVQKGNENSTKVAIPKEQVPCRNMKAEKRETKKASAETFRHICSNCGSTFKSQYKDDSYCCEQCAKEAIACGLS